VDECKPVPTLVFRVTSGAEGGSPATLPCTDTDIARAFRSLALARRSPLASDYPRRAPTPCLCECGGGGDWQTLGR
jgi:hypothetical protein